MSTDPVGRLTRAIAEASVEGADVFAPDAVLDATVPNWRFSVRGGPAVRGQLAHWFASPGRFEELRRTRVEGGELIEFTLAWDEDGEGYACHQVHHLEVAGDRIVKDTVFCGGRWHSSLLAEMEAAALAAAR